VAGNANRGKRGGHRWPGEIQSFGPVPVIEVPELDWRVRYRRFWRFAGHCYRRAGLSHPTVCAWGNFPSACNPRQKKIKGPFYFFYFPAHASRTASTKLADWGKTQPVQNWLTGGKLTRLFSTQLPVLPVLRPKLTGPKSTGPVGRPPARLHKRVADIRFVKR
jgi:hypothetical protein